MRRSLAIAIAAALSTSVLSVPFAFAEEKPAAPASVAPAARPAPKPISENVNKGVSWLVRHQLDSGAWGQGEESQQMGQDMEKIKDSPNIADTCMSVMALMRTGHTPAEGEHKAAVGKAIGFVCGEIEQSDSKDLFITQLRGTRTQGKLGTYIDTFVAAQLLAEVKGKMPDEKANRRVDEALAKVIRKIELNQQKDGRWANAGWAPVLAQAQAAKAINAAVINGADVSEKTREAVEQVARADFSDMAVGGGAGAGGISSGGVAVSEPAGGSVRIFAGRATAASGAGDAGVELYSRSSQLASMQWSANANGELRAKYQAILDSPTTQPGDKKEAETMLARFAANDKDLEKAQDAVVARLEDKQFVAGFGSNGGEEFLSHLNIGESLLAKGGEAWTKWDQAMTANLNRIQNADGSWTGHHCITGRTFCTSAALMVLTIDRAPIPASVLNKAER